MGKFSAYVGHRDNPYGKKNWSPCPVCGQNDFMGDVTSDRDMDPDSFKEGYEKALECATCGLSGILRNGRLSVDPSSIAQAVQNAKDLCLYDTGYHWEERSKGSHFDVDPSDFDDFEERMEKENREREERNKPHGKKAYIEMMRSATNG